MDSDDSCDLSLLNSPEKAKLNNAKEEDLSSDSAKPSKNDKLVSFEIESSDAIPFTSTEELQSCRDEDRSVTLIGYVDEILPSRTVGNAKKFQLYKIFLNNSDNCRSEVLIWNEMVAKVEPWIKTNQKVIIEQLRSKAVASTAFRLSCNLLPFEFNIQKNSWITVFGKFDPFNDIDGPAQELTWSDLSTATGKIVFKGFVKSGFRNTAAYGIGQGVIGCPEGRVDVEVHSFNEGEINFDRGTHVIVHGRIDIKRDTAFIIVENCQGVLIDPELTHTKVSLSDIFKNNKTPRRS